MDLSKSLEFFSPNTITKRVHIIGCGSVGSTIAQLIARFGITNVTLYDFDKVKAHNLVNQMFTTSDIGVEKTIAVKKHMMEINPECQGVRIVDTGYTDEPLNGYVFLAVDNIDLRRKIVQENLNNQNILAFFDVRTALTRAQHYAADWSKKEDQEIFLSTMRFNSSEVQNVVSACGVSLCVAPTVHLIANYAVMNMINFARGRKLKLCTTIDIETFEVISFEE